MHWPVVGGHRPAELASNLALAACLIVLAWVAKPWVKIDVA